MKFYPVLEKTKSLRIVGYQDSSSGLRDYLDLPDIVNNFVVATDFVFSTELQKVKCSTLEIGQVLYHHGELQLIIEKRDVTYQTIKLFTESSIGKFIMFIYDANELWSVAQVSKMRKLKK